MYFQLACFAFVITRVQLQVDPGTQSKVISALQTSSVFIGESKKHYENVAQRLKDFDKATPGSLDKFNKQQNALKVINRVGPALRGIGAVTALASFVFTFFMPTALEVAMEVIKQRFDEVDRKLDSMSDQMHKQTTEMKSSIRISTLMVNFVEWENAIKNTAAQLMTSRKAFSTATDQEQMMKISDDFLKYYARADVEGKILNIFRAVYNQATETHKNLFQLLIDEHGCDIALLSQVYVQVTNLHTQVAEQTVTYYQLKGMPDELSMKVNQIYDRVYKMRSSFNDFVFKCRSHTDTYAKSEVVKILDKNDDSLPHQLADMMYRKLSTMFPWCAWAVAFTKEPLNEPAWNVEHVGEFQNIMGDNLFTIKKYGVHERNLVVLWQFVGDLPTCINRVNINVVLFYEMCEECLLTSTKANENIPTRQGCNDNWWLNPAIHQNFDVYNLIHWIAAIRHEDASIKPCEGVLGQVCKNDGICQRLPFTTQSQCVCRKFYDGESCQTRFSIDDKIKDLIAESQKNFASMTGIPTVIDLHFELRDVSGKLDMIMTILRDGFSGVLAQDAEVLNSANHMAKKYACYLDLDCAITPSKYVHDFEKFFKTKSFDYIYGRLNEIIMGTGFLNSNNFLNEYKMHIATYYPADVCTENYVMKVDQLKKNLLLLDHALIESYLQFYQIKRASLDDDDRRIQDDEATRLTNSETTRQTDYTNLWKRTSCPTLAAEGMLNNACSDDHSYPGMEVEVLCASTRIAAQSRVSCVVQNNERRWTSQPSCDFFWTNWGSWSECVEKVSCQRSRRRACTGTVKELCEGVDREHKKCDEQECCLETDNSRFVCMNGKCISGNKKCDGLDDCGDGEDESKSTCPEAIYSGDTIALQSFYGRGFATCFGTDVNVDVHCAFNLCPGDTMDGADWARCIGSSFRIRAKNRGVNQPIRSGDKVAFEYTSFPALNVGSWLSCAGVGQFGQCTTRGCPGADISFIEGCGGEEFRIYGLDRFGSCGSDITTECYGAPLLRQDTVLIWFTRWLTPDLWLSGVNHVSLSSCPGKSITQDVTGRCLLETWTINRK